MDGGALTATIEVLVKTLIDVCKEEVELNRGLEENAEKLGKTLGVMQSYMDDAQTKVITQKTVENWLEEIEAASFDADNVLDELNYQFLSEKMKKIIKSTAGKKKIPSCIPFFKHHARRRKMALRVKKINETFESINNQATKHGLVSQVVSAPAVADVASPSRETNSFTLDPIFIGRENDVSEIVKMLTACQTEQVLSVLPIVGMGGLGKTTLTRNVFHHQNIKAHFGVCIWVHVGKKIFDHVCLLKKVLTKLKPNEKVGDGEASEAILEKLQEALGEKTYLLVLDDVWNEDQSKWEDFKKSISGISSNKGNIIIVTTRKTKVASIAGTLRTHEVRGLPDEDCWSIIKETTFEGGVVPTGFETIGKDIAKRCRGLPLAANVVGGVLRGKSVDKWCAIKDNWLSDVEEDHEKNISNILRLSYDHLTSPPLKKCFAYCSIFTKGKEIEKNDLIELWMAEGFLQPNHTSDMETVGYKFLNLLIQNSLLQVAKRDDYDNITHCTMHDLVHDLAHLVLKGEYYGHESGKISEVKAKCLRTLFYHDKVSYIIFSDFKSLHVLTLSGIEDVEVLPSSINELTHLRYLNVTKMKSLPESIGQLYHLQTLRAENTPMKLPSTLKYLISLRHLHVSRYTKLPAEIGMLTSLQTLRHFKVEEEKGHRIVELGNLQDLKGKLEIRNLEKVDGDAEAKNACLFKKPNIIKLVLTWNTEREDKREINDENVLEGLQPHHNLKMLEIFGFKGTIFPSWSSKMVGLDYLMEIKLSRCSECEEIPMMGHLPHLKGMLLSDLGNLKSIGASFYGIDNLCNSNNGVGEGTIIVFPSLKWIRLFNMRNLTEWMQVEVPSSISEVKVFPSLECLEISECPKLASAPSHEFPCLQELRIDECDELVNLPNLSFRNNQNLSQLYIKNCPKLRELPDGLHTLTSLEKLEIKKCQNIEQLDAGLPFADTCWTKLMSLKHISILSLEGLVSLPNWLFSNSPNLSELKIRDCLKLRELPAGLQTLTTLERLSIKECPNLESIAYDSTSGRGGLTSLKDLSIEDCSGLVNLPCEMVESCALSLDELTLKNLERLMNLPMIIDCLRKMSRLTSLTIEAVPKFIMPTLYTLRTLISLSLGPAASDSWDSYNSGVFHGILQAVSTSLKHLSLEGREDWESLPDQIQHLTAVRDLTLSNFGIEELPEWFGHFTFVEGLFLNNCQKLRRVEAMRRLTNLRRLSIQECPVLEERCGLIEKGINNNSDHSQWPNISHIPYIFSIGRGFIRFNGRTEEKFRYLDGA